MTRPGPPGCWRISWVPRDFEVLPHNKLRLYTFLDQPQTVNRVLLENGVGLISAQQRSSDLEDYFLSLIGGHHAAGKEGF